MDKKIIFGLFLLILVVIIALIFIEVNKDIKNILPIQEEQSLVDLSKFCDLNSPLNYRPLVVRECDYNNLKVYSIGYGAVDYPDWYFDSNKKFLFMAGGMPIPDQNFEEGILNLLNCSNGRNYSCKYE